MDSKRGIESVEGFKDIKGTPSDFKMFYNYGARGFTDIDQAYEKHGEFIFTEGKNVLGDSIDLPVGQFIFLDHLQAKLGDKSTVLLVGYRNKTYVQKIYWIATINQFKNSCLDKDKETKSGILKFKTMKLSDMRGPCSEEQYCKFIKNLCDSLEK